MSEARYRSHLTVLQMVLTLAKPRKILELGPGQYSTKAFLAADTTSSLTSIETDRDWFKRLKREIRDDRFTLRFAEYAPLKIPKDLRSYDLVFIDNGGCEEERVDVIRTVLSRPYPVVIIHDVEVPLYREAMLAHVRPSNYYIFNRRVPHTALIWP